MFYMNWERLGTCKKTAAKVGACRFLLFILLRFFTDLNRLIAIERVALLGGGLADTKV